MPFNGLTSDVVDGETVPKPEGMAYDILMAVTQAGGPRFTFDFGLPWNRAQHIVSEASNELVVIVPLTRTPERERQYRWISPLFEHQPRFSVLKENQSVDLDNIHDLRVAVIKGSGLLPVLEQMNIANLLLNTDAIINAKLLRHNRVHAIAESQYVDTYHWRKAGFDTQELRFIPLGAKQTIYIASNLDFPVAMSGRIARAIEDLRKQGVLMDILREWEK